MILTEYTPHDYEILEDNKVTGRMVVSGIFQKASESNQNGRTYPRKLWDRVLGETGIKGRITDRRMLGELDHPLDGKTSLARVSHVITDLKIDGDDYVRGKYEVLDTPHGRVLKELLRSQVKLGISSRGNGELKKDGGEAVVVPESYKLDTFDVVLDPSVEEAFPSVLKESFAQADNLVATGLVERLEEIGKQIVEVCRTNPKDPQKKEGSMAESVTVDNRIPQLELEISSLRRERDELGKLREDLNKLLGETNGKLETAKKLIDELTIREKTARFNAAGFREDVERLRGIDRKYVASKSIINELVTRVKEVGGVMEEYEASKLLNAAFLELVQDLNMARAISKVLATESRERVDAFRPILARCGSIEEVKATYETLSKSAGGLVPKKENKIDLPTKEVLSRAYPGSGLPLLRPSAPLVESTSTRPDKYSREAQVALAKGIVQKMNASRL